jgi:hypothetical protein
MLGNVGQLWTISVQFLFLTTDSVTIVLLIPHSLSSDPAIRGKSVFPYGKGGYRCLRKGAIVNAGTSASKMAYFAPP